MALVRIAVAPVLSRLPYAASVSPGPQKYDGPGNNAQRLHVSGTRRYPEVPLLPLPINVSEIFANETGRFTPERSRDFAAPVVLYGGDQSKSANFPTVHDDTHVDSYDCFGAVSLNGLMQSNVPQPFSSRGKSTHLNMPGGQWSRDNKYIAEDMQKSHYASPFLRGQAVSKFGCGYAILSGSNSLRRTYHLNNVCRLNYSITSETRWASVDGDNAPKGATKKLTRKELVKKYMKEYGKTFIVVHIGVSLMSLAGFYTAVRSGMDLMPIADYWINTVDMDLEHRELLRSSRDFTLAYLVHKVIFPIRLGITLTITPLITAYTTRNTVDFTPYTEKLDSTFKKPPVYPKEERFVEHSVNKPIESSSEPDNAQHKKIKDT